MSNKFKNLLNIFNKNNKNGANPQPQQSNQNRPQQSNQNRPQQSNQNRPQQSNQIRPQQTNNSNNRNQINTTTNIQNKFPKNFDEYIERIKKIKHPLKDCKKIDYVEKDGIKLDIYEYVNKSQSSDSDHSISIIFVGQSGAGKSTVINAYVNFLLGAYHDQQCRYKIVLGNKEKEKDQTKSQTEEITMYKINSPIFPGITFKLIDTPGFADTENKETESRVEQNSVDKKHLERFEEFFNNKLAEDETGLILGICFVVKAAENRVTNFQKLIISSILNLFGKNVGSNFLALLTHADSDEPNAVQVLTKEIEVFKKKEQEKANWYWCVSSIKYFEIIKSRGAAGMFEDAIENFINFTLEIIKLPVIDMTLTKTNLHLKRSLNNLKKSIKTEQLDILLQKYNILKNSQVALDKKIEECNKKQKELEEKQEALNKKTNEKKKIDNEITSLDNEIEKCDSTINNCNIQITNFQNNLKEVNSNLNDLENKVKEGEKIKNELYDQKINAEKELKEIEEKIKSYSPSPSQNNNNNISLDQSINDLQTLLDQKKESIKTLETNINTYNNEKQNIEKEINENKKTKDNLDKQIKNLNSTKTSLENEKAEKENEQKEIIKKYNDLNNTYQSNSSIDILNTLIKSLEESKKNTKTINVPYEDIKEIESKVRNLRCEKCKRNCCENCSCKWGLFFLLGRSWWCNNINKNGKCKVCDCDYTNHKRDYKYFQHNTRQKPKQVGLDDKEIKEIDDNIKEIKAKIKREEELMQKINEHNENKVKIDKKINKEIKDKESVEKEIKEKEDNLEQLKKQKKLKEIQEKEKEIEENENKRNTLKEKKKTTETQIGDEREKVIKANAKKDINQLLLDKEKKQQELIQKEVNDLQDEKDKLFNEIKDKFNVEKKKLEDENKVISDNIKNIETETIKQIIKMKVITEEIAKIEMKNEKTQSFDKQLQEIYDDNKYFIKNSQQFEPLKNEINKKLNENQENVMREFNIKREDLINFKAPNKK